MRYLLFFWLLLPVILAGCSLAKNKSPDAGSGSGASSYVCESTPVAKGSRQFGMDILDVPSVGTYSDSLSHLTSLGGSFQTFHTTWSALEGTGSGNTSGTFTDAGNALASLNTVAGATGTKVTLRIHPVDVPGKFVPSDLSSTRFNSNTVQTRFRSLIDFVFTKISPSRVTRLVVGNEVDGYSATGDSNFWQDYPVFLYDLNVWLNTNYPSVELGFVITADGATDGTKVLANSGGQKSVDVLGDSGWAAAVDFVGVTYYPLTSQFEVNSNSLVSSVFQNLVTFTTKPIHVEEVGFPSSSANSGSDFLQAEFFCEVLKAWDSHRTRIPSLAILRMVDKTRADAENVATSYGLTGNEKFIEYIRTLGLRTNTSVGKQSFSTIQSELQKRGF